MAFDWKQYLNLSIFLQGWSGENFTSESAHRCAVSRAYFAAFCYARNFAHEKLDFCPSYSGDDHGHLIKHLKKKRRVLFANYLTNLRQWRNACDYEDELLNTSKMVEDAILEAQRVFDNLK